MMKTRLTILCLLFSTHLAFAAQQVMLWNKATAIPFMQQTNIFNDKPSDQLNTNAATRRLKTFHLAGNPQALYFLSAKVDKNNITHIRYNQYFHKIPVYGYQTIAHVNSQNTAFITGYALENIAKDVLSTTPSILKKTAIETTLADFENNTHSQAWHIKGGELLSSLVIYQKENSHTAHLAYKVEFFASRHTPQGELLLHQPIYMIDANNGKIIDHWDSLSTEYDNNNAQNAQASSNSAITSAADAKPLVLKSRVSRNENVEGQGPGGWTEKVAEAGYPPELFQFGDLEPNIPSFGKLNFHENMGICTLANDDFKINEDFGKPTADYKWIFSWEERNYPPKHFICHSPKYENRGRDVNGGREPSNGALYFATETQHMFETEFGIQDPFNTHNIGGMFIYTHLQDYDNASAIGALGKEEIINGKVVFLYAIHSQLLIGNGHTMFLPLAAPKSLAHELGHIYTTVNSRLIYNNQSGGINESFSDIIGMALAQYLHEKFSWYDWGSDEQKWQFGYAFTKTDGLFKGKPTRYLYDPTLDGKSIKNAADFYEGMNVHHSSGVYNYAFYLMSTQYKQDDLGINNIASLFIDANRYLWTPTTTFNYGACGVVQEAIDHHFTDKQIADVKAAFKEVGIECDAPSANF